MHQLDKLTDFPRLFKLSLQNLKLYPLGHTITQKSITNFYNLIVSCIEPFDKFQISMVLDSLLLNGEKTSPEITKKMAMNDLRKIFDSIGINGLIFKEGLEKEELNNLVLIINEGTTLLHDNWRQIFEERNIHHIEPDISKYVVLQDDEIIVSDSDELHSEWREKIDKIEKKLNGEKLLDLQKLSEKDHSRTSSDKRSRGSSATKEYPAQTQSQRTAQKDEKTAREIINRAKTDDDFKQIIQALGNTAGMVQALKRVIQEDNRNLERLIKKFHQLEDRDNLEILNKIIDATETDDQRELIKTVLNEQDRTIKERLLTLLKSSEDKTETSNVLSIIELYKSPEIYDEIMQTFASMEPDKLSHLIDASNKLDESERFDISMKLARSKYTNVAAKAIKALGDLGDPHATEFLTKNVKKRTLWQSKKTADIQRESAISLGKLNAISAVGTMAKNLKNPVISLKRATPPLVKIAIIWSLGQIATPQAIKAIEEATRDNNKNVARMAKYTLFKLKRGDNE